MVQQVRDQVERIFGGLEIDLDAVSSANVSGRGGKESQLSRLFPGLTRESKPLYDFVDAEGIRYEVKKQKDLQWFDLSKYHDLSCSERDIRLLVVLLDGSGKIDKIFIALLGQFIDKMSEINPDWSRDVRKSAHIFRKSLRDTQIKTPVYLRKMTIKFPDLFEVVYERV